MSLLLALDTATDRATIALGVPGRAGTQEIELAARRDLSREIEHVTTELLRREDAEPRDLAGVVVADGPGSFTGLRIGVAFAKGLCRGLGIPMLTAPSMLGAAANVRSVCPSVRRSTVVVEYDALRREVYRAVYGFADGAVTVELPPGLAPAGSPADVAPGFQTATEAQASAASLIALRDVSGGLQSIADAPGFEPNYGRLAEAEARRLQHGR